MFYAIKSTDKKRYRASIVNNMADTQEAGTYNWFVDPRSFENWDEQYKIYGDELYDIKVHYRSASEKTSSLGKLFNVAPHFVCSHLKKYGLQGESPEHKLVNNFLYNEIETAYKNGNCKIELIYCELSKPCKYNFTKKLSSFALDFEKLDLEVTSKDNGSNIKTRADIFIPFLKKDSLFGNGINFEIQFSKQNQNKTNIRTYQRAIHGKSTVWLFKEDFNIDGAQIELKNNSLKCYNWASSLFEHKKNWGKDFKFMVETQTTLINKNLDKLKIELINKNLEIENKYEEYLNKFKVDLDCLCEKYQNKIKYQPGYPCPKCFEKNKGLLTLNRDKNALMCNKRFDEQNKLICNEWVRLK